MLCETLAAAHYSSSLFPTVTLCLPASPNRRRSVKDSLNCLISIILHIMTAGNRWILESRDFYANIHHCTVEIYHLINICIMLKKIIK